MSDRIKADLAMALVCALWGATFVVVQRALVDSSVQVYMTLRFGVAALVMLAISGKQLRAASRGAMWSGAAIGAVMFAGYAFQNNGLLLTTATKSAFITGTAVVLVPVFLAVTGGRVNRWVWAGAVAALLGVYLLTVPQTEGIAGFRELNRGDLLTLAAATLFAVHVILVSRATRRHSVVALNTYQCVAGALLSLLAVGAFHGAGLEPAIFRWTPQLVAAVLLTGIAGTAIAFSVQVWAQRHTSPTHMGILLTLEPVFAGITSYLFLNERLSGRAWAGAALILAGILLAELRGPVQSAADAPTPASTFVGRD